MQKLRSEAGLTLIEIMTVVAIVGIISSLGFAALRGYNRHEDTRRAASTVAGLLTRARSEALAQGRMTFVIFGEPTDGSIPFAPGQFAALVEDENGDGLIDPATDAVSPVFWPTGLNPDVTTYGAHGDTVMKGTLLPDMDESQAVPAGDLTTLTGGSTIPVDATLGVPVIAFSPQLQGSAVSLASPNSWGSGAGGVYFTDNNQMLLAVIVQPLGDVHTMAFDTGSGQWK